MNRWTVVDEWRVDAKHDRPIISAATIRKPIGIVSICEETRVSLPAYPIKMPAIAALISVARKPPSSAHAESGQVAAATRGHRSDATELNADGGEVGEPGQGENGQLVRPLLHPLHASEFPVYLDRVRLGQVEKGDELVEHELLAEQLADPRSILRRHTHEKCNRSEELREEPLQRQACGM